MPERPCSSGSESPGGLPTRRTHRPVFPVPRLHGASDPMALNSFKDVQDMLTAFVTSQGVPISGAPHVDFWNQLTYAQFTTGDVPGVTDPTDPTKGMPILKIGD